MRDTQENKYPIKTVVYMARTRLRRPEGVTPEPNDDIIINRRSARCPQCREKIAKRGDTCAHCTERTAEEMRKSEKEIEDQTKEPEKQKEKENPKAVTVSLVEFITALAGSSRRSKTPDETQFLSADEAEESPAVTPQKNILDELETSKANATVEDFEISSEAPKPEAPSHPFKEKIGLEPPKNFKLHLHSEIASSTPKARGPKPPLASSPVKRKRFKKYERSKQKLIINPSSESEEEKTLPKPEADSPNATLAAHQVEILPNGSSVFNGLEQQMMEDLSREEEQLREEERSVRQERNREVGRVLEESVMEEGQSSEKKLEDKFEPVQVSVVDVETNYTFNETPSDRRLKKTKLNKKRKSNVRKRQREGERAVPESSIRVPVTPRNFQISEPPLTNSGPPLKILNSASLYTSSELHNPRMAIDSSQDSYRQGAIDSSPVIHVKVEPETEKWRRKFPNSLHWKNDSQTQVSGTQIPVQNTQDRFSVQPQSTNTTIPQTHRRREPKKIKLIPFKSPPKLKLKPQKTVAEQLQDRFSWAGNKFEGFGVDSDDSDYE